VGKKDLEANVRHLEERVRKERKLEETCIQQEKVIQKMERLLSKYMKNNKPATEMAKPEGWFWFNEAMMLLSISI